MIEDPACRSFQAANERLHAFAQENSRAEDTKK
jgi:hypothetical protein